MRESKNNQGNQTEAAKRKLICYIQDRKLKEGDSLPPQSELRKLFSVGAFTIQRAIAALQESGILETIPHHAVKVKSLNVDGYNARQIALVCLRRSYIPSSMILLQCLQQQLADQNCQCKLFLRNSDKMTDTDSLSDFDGLQRCIEQGVIHGILTTVSFDAASWQIINDNHIPVVSMETASHNRGCKVAFESILPQAFEIIRERSLHRPALIHCGYPVADEIKAEFSAVFPQEADRYCRVLFPEIIVEDAPLPIVDAVSAILDDFCTMEPAKRPDSLIIPDDFLMNFVYAEILRRRLLDPSFLWQPHFIYISHVQNRFFTPSTSVGDCFEYDIMQCAESAVRALHSKMTGNTAVADEQILIKPKVSRCTGKIFPDKI